MITRIYIHNFRCFENFELLLGDRTSTLLVGRNGTGKTTLRKALELLQSVARGTTRIRDLVSPQAFAGGRTNVPMRFEIEAVIKGTKFAYVLAFEFPEGFKELRILDESLTVNGQPYFQRTHAQVIVPAQATAKNEAKFLVDWHLVALPLVFERSDKDPLKIFRSWLGRMVILSPIPSLITGDSYGDTLFPKVDGTNFGDWFAGLLSHSPAVYSVVENFVQQMMPDFQDIQSPLIGKDSRSSWVQFKSEPHTLSVPFSELSDGEKCFFVCAVAVAATRVYGPIFCFWDEPDNYLALSEVAHFVMNLRGTFRDGNQIMVTSHNPEAIRQFSPDNTFLLYRRHHLEPVIARPMNEVEVHGDLVDAMIRGDVEL